MVSSCLDAHTGIYHEDIIQVRAHSHFMALTPQDRPGLLGPEAHAIPVWGGKSSTALSISFFLC